ncbi:hypothetical protein ACSS6W_000334 [Trichoderma asperelloides]
MLVAALDEAPHYQRTMVAQIGEDDDDDVDVDVDDEVEHIGVIHTGAFLRR